MTGGRGGSNRERERESKRERASERVLLWKPFVGKTYKL